MAILHPHGIVGVNDLPKKFRHIEEQEIAREPLNNSDISLAFRQSC